MKRTDWSRLAATALAVLASAGLVLEVPCLVGLSATGVSVAEARPGGGPRGGGPRDIGPAGRPDGGLRYGGGPPQGPRPSVHPAGQPGPRPVAPPPGGRPAPGPEPRPVPPPPGPGPRPVPPPPGPGPRPVPPPPPGPRAWGPPPPPVARGPWLWTLPATAVALTVAGATYYNYNSTCYIQQYQGDNLVYVPVTGPCPPPGY